MNKSFNEQRGQSTIDVYFNKELNMSDTKKASQSELIGFIFSEYRESIRLQEEQVATLSGLTEEEVKDIEAMKPIKNLDKLSVLAGFYGFSLGEYFHVVDLFIYHLEKLGVEITPDALNDLIKNATLEGLTSGVYMKEVRANGYRPFLKNAEGSSTILTLIQAYLGKELNP